MVDYNLRKSLVLQDVRDLLSKSEGAAFLRQFSDQGCCKSVKGPRYDPSTTDGAEHCDSLLEYRV